MNDLTPEQIKGALTAQEWERYRQAKERYDLDKNNIAKFWMNALESLAKSRIENERLKDILREWKDFYMPDSAKMMASFDVKRESRLFKVTNQALLESEG